MKAKIENAKDLVIIINKAVAIDQKIYAQAYRKNLCWIPKPRAKKVQINNKEVKEKELCTI
jgi:hypothetical protein